MLCAVLSANRGSDHFDGESAIEQRDAAVDHVALLATFDDIFAFVMHDQGALLGLGGRVVADINQGLDHPIKGIDMVVEQHDAKCFCYNRFDRGLDKLFGTHLAKNLGTYNNGYQSTLISKNKEMQHILQNMY